MRNSGPGWTRIGLLLALLLSAGLCSAGQVDSVEFGHMRVLKLKGTIEPGDLQVLNNQQNNHAQPADALQIESPGGDQDTAMSIGRFARAAMLSVTAGRECAGTCILAWLGGVQRELIAPINTADDLKDGPALRAYLAEMEVSAAGIEALLAPQAEILMPDHAIKLFGRDSPGHKIWLAGQCAQFNETEQRDWANIRALQAVEASMSSMGMGGNNAMLALGAETQTSAAAARDLSPKYVEELNARNTEMTACRRSAVAHAREESRLSN